MSRRKRRYQEGGEVEDSESLGALGSLAEYFENATTTTPEGREAATRILSRYLSDDESEEDYWAPEHKLIERMQSQADQVREALRAGRERLAAQRYMPGQALLAASAALGQPTRTGALGETIANTFGAVAGPLAQREQLERGRDEQLTEMDVQLAGVDSNVLGAEMDLAQLQRRLQASMEEEALKVLGRPLRSGSGASGTRQAKISDLVQMGIPWETAVKITDGIIEMEVVEGTGRVRLTDRASRRAWEIELEPNEPFTGQPSTGGREEPGAPLPAGLTPAATGADVRDTLRPGDQSLWELAGPGTGLWATVRELASVPAALVPGDAPPWMVAEETIQARQAFSTEIQELIRSLAVNERFPVGEQERLREEIQIVPSIWRDERALQNKMVSVDNSLRRRMQAALRDANDIGAPEDLRQSQEQNAAAIRRFLPILGVPPGIRDVAPDRAPREVQEAWPDLTVEERNQVLRSLDDLGVIYE